jgi:hypothetical protein
VYTFKGEIMFEVGQVFSFKFGTSAFTIVKVSDRTLKIKWDNGNEEIIFIEALSDAIERGMVKQCISQVCASEEE